MRIEILLCKKQKVSQAIVEAFQAEVHGRIVSVFPVATVHVRQGNVAWIVMQGFSLDKDRQRISEIIKSIWESDGWKH